MELAKLYSLKPVESQLLQVHLLNLLLREDAVELLLDVPGGKKEKSFEWAFEDFARIAVW